MNDKKLNQLLLFIVILSFGYFLLTRNSNVSVQEQKFKDKKILKTPELSKKPKLIQNKMKVNAEVGPNVKSSTMSNPIPSNNFGIQVKQVLQPSLSQEGKQKESNSKAAKFKLEDGLVTIAGDIVLGVPNVPDFPNQGLIEIPDFSIWDSAEIPFHIQSSLPNQNRIYAAFEIFKDSPIHFVPLTDQADAIVFEVKPGTCKSYVGKIGGFQPIWIGSECSAQEIAHEIMHALGFIHEQNRADRDGFIEIIWDNIQEDFKYNFELLPDFYMKLSGATVFDFDSLMIYPASSFAKKNGLITIKSKQSQKIKPGLGLSVFDLERLQKFYGQ
jgi:hypothetical protein